MRELTYILYKAALLSIDFGFCLLSQSQFQSQISSWFKAHLAFATRFRFDFHFFIISIIHTIVGYSFISTVPHALILVCFLYRTFPTRFLLFFPQLPSFTSASQCKSLRKSVTHEGIFFIILFMVVIWIEVVFCTVTVALDLE